MMQNGRSLEDPRPVAAAMSRGRLLIRGGHVVTLDPHGGTISDGEVLIEGDIIVAVGRDLGVTDAEIIDARGRIVAPGTIDAHRHTWQTQLRGCCSDMSLGQYLMSFWAEAVSSYTPDDARLGVLVGALEALDSGVTTIYDYSHITKSPAYADASVEALTEAGIRAVYGYGLGQVVDPMGPAEFDRMADLRRLAGDKLMSSDLVTLGVGLSEVGFVPMSVTLAQKQLADELGAVSAVHIAPNWSTPTGVAELARAGVLDQRLICAHACTLSKGEWDLLGAAGVSFVSTPETEINLGAKAPAIRQALARGLRPAIGTDIATLTGASVLAAARLGLTYTRLADAEQSNNVKRDLDKIALSADQALAWATTNGADAVGLGHRVGSLTPGKQADVIIVGGRHLGARPVNDPIGQLVFQTTPAQVETVIVNGRILKRDGRLVGVDLGRLLDQLDDSAQVIRQRMAQHRQTSVASPPETSAAMPAWMAGNLRS